RPSCPAQSQHWSGDRRSRPSDSAGISFASAARVHGGDSEIVDDDNRDIRAFVPGMRAALVVLVVAVGLIGSIRSRYVALLLYVWFALFRPQEWAYGAVTSLRLSVVIWFALVAPALFSGVLPNITHPLSLGTIAFVLCTLLAQL